MNEDAGHAPGERLTVLRAQGGDRAAFGMLVSLYEQRLMYYVRRLVRTPEECQDVLQETWLQVFRSLPRLESPQAFRVWLYRIAHRRAMTHGRRRVDDASNDGPADESVSIDHWNELELLENAEFVHHALEQLSAAHREVLALRFLEEMDVREIAEIVGCGEGTAKSRLHYAKLALRTLLEGGES